MPDKTYTIKNKNGGVITVSVQRDKRLKKSSRWQWVAKSSILLRIPHRLQNRNIEGHIDEIASKLAKQEKLAERRTDSELHKRAEHINHKYFQGRITWRAIRWVNNMNTRLGSCTNGGVTDGHIRISANIRHWPQWVVDYVLAHELVHRLYPNHSPDFWGILTENYPLTERARGFIRGVGFTEGVSFEEDD